MTGSDQPMCSTTELSYWQECQEKWKHAYVLMLEPVAIAAPLSAGKVWHSFLNCYWTTGGDFAEASEAMLKAVRAVDLAKLQEKPRENFVRRSILLTAASAVYHKKYQGEAGVWLMQPELHLTVPGKFHGYTDMLLKDRRTGEYILRESKTMSSNIARPNYWDKLQLDAQLMDYLWMLGESGIVPSRVEYETTILTQHKQGIREGELGFRQRMAEYYDEHPELISRTTINIPDHAMERRSVDRDALIAQIRSARETGIVVRNTHQCANNYGMCKFFAICQTGKVDPFAYQPRTRHGQDDEADEIE